MLMGNYVGGVNLGNFFFICHTEKKYIHYDQSNILLFIRVCVSVVKLISRNVCPPFWLIVYYIIFCNRRRQGLNVLFSDCLALSSNPGILKGWVMGIRGLCSLCIILILLFARNTIQKFSFEKQNLCKWSISCSAFVTNI